ncbi:MAG TPA: YtxH domain-containing protein [Peptostreptococcaceae bacterium]|nr:YtxH domain-containing protein [Peptostreptococcaceae bacterium]
MGGKKRYFVLGSIFGAILALLFSPKKGSSLREDIKDKYKEYKDDPNESVNNTLKIIGNRLSNIIEKFDEEDIEIQEKELIISKTFDEEGENK